MPLKILVIGAGVCGPALAVLLNRADPTAHEITIIDRSPRLRTGGQQIDLRAQGIPIVRKMGLLDAMKARVVPESGFAFVDSKGRIFAAFPTNNPGENEGAQKLTSEYELMRGDIVEVFYRASLGLDPTVRAVARGEKGGDEEEITANGTKVRYEFGVSVTSLRELEDGSSVQATFSDGRTEHYDLVVGADGQGSRTRAVVLGNGDWSTPRAPGSDPCFRSLGLWSAFYNIPRREVDGGMMLAHGLPGRRSIAVRAADRKRPAQVYLSFMDGGEPKKNKIDKKDETDRDSLRCAMWRSAEHSERPAKEVFVSKFANSDAWRVPEFVSYLQPEKGFSHIPKDFDTDFYATEIGQVHCPVLSKGRIVLLGDAGYAPSPITGMGTTLSLTGAYILAGELCSATNNNGGKVDVLAALRGYETKLRPYIKSGQTLPPGAPGIIHPESAWGVWILGAIVFVAAKILPAIEFLLKFVPAYGSPVAVPEYPELKLEE